MNLLIFGLGFSGTAIARHAAGAGYRVTVTSRNPAAVAPDGVGVIDFNHAAGAIRQATHLLATAPPGEHGDPVLARYAADIEAAPALRWLGYLSTTGVYGDRGGDWVDEDTAPAPGAPRSQRRLAAEQAWRAAAGERPLDLFRLAGIYGPGRSALDDVRSGRARRILRPGHAFGRIHVDDIAGGVVAAMAHTPDRTRVLNFSDDEPAESADVIAEAARLLGQEPPHAVLYEDALPAMSEMARSFWAENRRVRSARTQEMLGYSWRYPSYHEGLRAILAARSRREP